MGTSKKKDYKMTSRNLVGDWAIIWNKDPADRTLQLKQKRTESPIYN